ncbi:MAG: ATP-dependent zinc metalloprotease FtsH [Polyangiales bacterium]
MADPRDDRRSRLPPEPEEPSPAERRVRAVLTVLVALLAAMLVVAEMSPGAKGSLPYYEFKNRVRAGRVAEVLIGESVIRGRFQGSDAQGAPSAGPFSRAPRMDFETVRVADPQLVPLLEEKGVHYAGLPEGRSAVPLMIWGFMLLGLVLLGRSLFRRFQNQTGSVLAFGRSKGKVVGENEVSVRFSDVAGVDEAKAELEEVVEFLKSPEKFTRIGARIPKGVLLVGPPGTGKTLLAKAVAGEAGVAFFSLSGSEFVEMFVGVGAARVRDLFENAKTNAPCIVFIDELDALGRSRGANVLGTNEEREQTLNQLLVEMDGFETNKGVILLAATNRPEILDPALLRPGRFDRQVLVDRPDKKGREAILKVHARQVKLAPEVDMADVAARTPGFAGADLANVINEAALLAARHDKETVSRADIEEAIERVSAGLERKSRIISPEEKRRVAHHEVGHAIVGELIPGGSHVAKISVVPRGRAALGYTMMLPTEDRYLMTESEIEAQLAGLLGGRVAEQIVFGEVSTGAGNDLAKATELARAMVVDYGMSPAIGPVTLGHERTSPFLAGAEGTRAREHGESLADLVDQEVKRIVEQAERRAREILDERREALERIAQTLIEREYLDGDEFRAMLGISTPPDAHKDAVVIAGE